MGYDQPAALAHVKQAPRDGQVRPEQGDPDQLADDRNHVRDSAGTEADQPADPEMRAACAAFE
jgi:hypothetical protein